jgi:DNA primase
MNMRDYADAVKQSVPAIQAARMLGLNPDAHGFCKCPIHGEKTGSMKLYPGNRGWYCFGCHTGGSVIDLVMECNGMTLRGAVEWLNDEFNLGLPIGKEASPEQEAEARKRAEQRKAEQERRQAMEAAKNAAFERYLDIGAEMRKLEEDIEKYAPSNPDAPLAKEYIYAMHKLPVLKAEAEEMAIAMAGKEET